MVVVKRRRQIKNGLQEAVNMRCVKQIRATHNVRHPLPSIIDNNRNVIAGAGILSRHDNIAEHFWLRMHAASLLILPEERACAVQCRLNIKPPSKGQCIGRRIKPMPTCPGIEALCPLRR